MELITPSFIMDDNHVRAFEIKKGDVIEYTLSEFLKPLNINMLMNNKFTVVGYGSRRDYWYVKIFNKYKKIYKPFVRIKTVQLEYVGD